MSSATILLRRHWAALLAATCGALVTAVLVASTPERASSFFDPNEVTFNGNSFQDTLDFAIIKCALDRPDCVGGTNGPGGFVQVTFDGRFYGLFIHPAGSPPIQATVSAKKMEKFQNSLLYINSLNPVPGPSVPLDPNEALPVIPLPGMGSDHTFDPNDAQMRITSTLSFNFSTADDQKGMITVSVSPSLAVRWNLMVK